MDMDHIIDSYIHKVNKILSKLRQTLEKKNNEKYIINAINYIDKFIINIEDEISKENDEGLNKNQIYYFNEEILPKLIYMHTILSY